MTDYKELLTGTLNKITDTVRSVANPDTVREIYTNGASRAKGYAKITKLMLDKKSTNDELSRVFAEIGRLCYEQTREAPEVVYAGLFSRVEELTAALQAKEDEIAAVKAATASAPAEDSEEAAPSFEDIVAQSEQPDLAAEEIVPPSEDAPAEP